MGDFSAVGDAITGAALARSVEPSAGEAAGDGYTHEAKCLNCGHQLAGPYCSQCGQKAHVPRSVRHFAQDFLQGLFNFEGKFWHTLPMLVWRPGEMTRRYIAGQRATFISPVALYLFTVFAMFATLNFTGALTPAKGININLALEHGIADDQAKLAKLQAERNADAAANKDVAALDRKIAKVKEDIGDSQNVLNGKVANKVDGSDGLPDWLAPFVDNARKNPELVTAKIEDAASKFSWLLIPISVPFLWLLFPFRRRYKTYDHMVFVTYSLSFMMLLVVTGSLLVAIGFTTLASLLFFVPPFHMYRHLKGAYELGKWGALLRTTALVGFAFAAAGMFMVAAVAIGMRD